MTLLAIPAHCQTAADALQPAKPKVYALVAALGSQFSILNENHDATQQSLPHLEQLKFIRDTRVAPDNLLNILALQGLDKVVARLEPDSKRIFLTFGAAPLNKYVGSKREDDVLAWIRTKLKEVPQRREWDRILVATPAYRVFDHEGIASQAGMMTRLQGLGIFTQPYGNALGIMESIKFDTFKEDALSPENKEVRSSTYVAPFAYLEIWILDPADLSVIDKQTRYEHKKLADPFSGSLDLNQSIPKDILAREMVGVIEGSIHEAVMQSKMNAKLGVIEVGPVKQVNPDEIKK